MDVRVERPRGHGLREQGPRSLLSLRPPQACPACCPLPWPDHGAITARGCCSSTCDRALPAVPADLRGLLHPQSAVRGAQGLNGTASPEARAQARGGARPPMATQMLLSHGRSQGRVRRERVQGGSGHRSGGGCWGHRHESDPGEAGWAGEGGRLGHAGFLPHVVWGPSAQGAPGVSHRSVRGSLDGGQRAHPYSRALGPVTHSLSPRKHLVGRQVRAPPRRCLEHPSPLASFPLLRGVVAGVPGRASGEGRWASRSRHPPGSSMTSRHWSLEEPPVPVCGSSQPPIPAGTPKPR